VVVFSLYAAGIDSVAANALAATALVARVCQSLVHIATVQTDRVVTVRFSFFFLQLLCFVGIAGVVLAARAPL
jgi:cellobiose-specific phosphotransferase system component IIC